MNKVITRLPFPWYDPILSILSRSCYTIQQHYLREFYIKRNKVCAYCKNKGKTHFHHIIPIAEFGMHSNSNLIELCIGCHRKAEIGIINISKKGKYFYRGLRIKRKILLKIYKENTFEDNFSRLHNFPTKKFIIKHLDTDFAIKYLLKTKQTDKLKELFIDWKKEEIIKEIPKIHS